MHRTEGKEKTMVWVIESLLISPPFVPLQSDQSFYGKMGTRGGIRHMTLQSSHPGISAAIEVQVREASALHQAISPQIEDLALSPEHFA
jgi:hypothetical protein